jgi:hypothetical protein
MHAIFAHLKVAREIELAIEKSSGEYGGIKK